MTLRQPNIERMLQLGLTGMAEALEEQRDIADIEQLGFDDRLAMLIEREAGHREHRSYLGHLRAAQLRIRADVQDVDCRAGRGIARTTLTQLAAGDWIRQALNLDRATGRRARERPSSLARSPTRPAARSGPSSTAASPNWSRRSTAPATRAPMTV